MPRTAPTTSPPTGSHQRDLEARPGRGEIDLLLGVEGRMRRPGRRSVAHAAATLAAAQSPLGCESPRSNGVVGSQPSSTPRECASYRPPCAPHRLRRRGIANDLEPALRRSGRASRSPRASSPRRRRRRCNVAPRAPRSIAAIVRVDRVVDVREAARLRAVAVQLERPALGEARRPSRERHVRALPRAVDREVADARRRRARTPRRTRARGARRRAS